MIYGNKFLPKHKESVSMMEFGVESVVYNEYHNYKNLLESCTDLNNRPILEAQVKILYEISFKDIWNAFIRAIDYILEKINDLIDSIYKMLKSMFKPFDIDKTIELYRSLKSELSLKERYMHENDEASDIDIEITNYADECCDLDILYFYPDRYYVFRDDEARNLDAAMVKYASLLKDSSKYEQEMKENFDHFKDKYYLDNETEFSICRAPEIIYNPGDSDTDVINREIAKEKSKSKLKDIDQLLNRLKDIRKEYYQKAEEIGKYSNKMKYYVKKLKALLKNSEHNLKDVNTPSYKNSIMNFHKMVKFNISCYQSACDYMKSLSKYTSNTYNKAWEINNNLESKMIKLYNKVKGRN